MTGRELSSISESSEPELIVDADGVRHDLLVIIDALQNAESSGASQTEVLVSAAQELSALSSEAGSIDPVSVTLGSAAQELSALGTITGARQSAQLRGRLFATLVRQIAMAGILAGNVVSRCFNRPQLGGKYFDCCCQ